MKRMILCAASALALCTASASAQTLNFDFSSAQYTATFQLDSSPTPNNVGGSAPYHYTAFNGVAGTLNGNPFVFNGLIFPADDYSANGATGGGFSYDYNFSNYFQGEQLFTGTVDQPTFKTGTFLLTSYSNGLPGTLTISAAGVPEPATWAMMIGGFAVAGAAMRRRKVATTYA